MFISASSWSAFFLYPGSTRRGVFMAWVLRGLFALVSGVAWPVRLTAEAPKAPEFCAPGSVLPVTPNQPESTRKMAARLQEITRLDDPYRNPYRFEEKAEKQRAMLAQTTDIDETLKIKWDYAISLLGMGKSEEALGQWEDYERLMKKNNLELTVPLFTMLYTWKAICCLRLGEQENCLYNHTAESCLLPIRGGGVHQFPRGSRKAIEMLTPLLQRFPGDLRARWLLNIAYMTLGRISGRRFRPSG